jgi:hypothetical protein
MLGSLNCLKSLSCGVFGNQGSNSIKASVLKDGHTFTVHVTDPQLYTGIVEKPGSDCVQVTADEHSTALNVLESETVMPDNGKYRA